MTKQRANCGIHFFRVFRVLFLGQGAEEEMQIFVTNYSISNANYNKWRPNHDLYPASNRLMLKNGT